MDKKENNNMEWSGAVSKCEWLWLFTLKQNKTKQRENVVREEEC